MPSKVETIEARYGKHIVDILKDLFAQHKSISEVARVLSVRPSTVNYWLLKYGLEIKIELIEKVSS